MTSKWTSFKVALAAIGLLAIGALIPSMFAERVSAQFADQSTFVISSRVTGSANAINLSIPNVVNLNQILGVPIRFLPGATAAAGGATVQINSLTAKTVDRITGNGLVPIAGGDFQSGVLAEVMWDGTEIIHKNPATGNDNVGTEINLTGSTVPLGYLPESGTCVSQTTYAALYAYYGSTDLWETQNGGTPCGGGLFHLPFANGRTAFAPDTFNSVTANILTSGGSGCAATGVAVGCGAQNHALSSTSQLPQFTPTGTIGGSYTTTGSYFEAGAGSFTLSSGGVNGFVQITVPGSSFNFTGSAIGSGSPSPLTTIPALYTIAKAVKY